MLDNLKPYRVILASNSPRRKELLGGLDLSFEVRIIPGIDESYPTTLDSREIPLFIARKKAEAYWETLGENELLITADTVVWTPEGILEKPKDRLEACAMLRVLSGCSHRVITGVCLHTCAKQIEFSVESEVCFSWLEEAEIEYYVDRYRPFDKAGGYGIQEWIGYIGVESIQGSFYNVMGLPVQRLYKELKKF